MLDFSTVIGKLQSFRVHGRKHQDAQTQLVNLAEYPLAKIYENGSIIR
jgi:hypothetical protein